MLLFILIPILYLMLGAVIARKDYARRLHSFGDTSVLEREIKKLEVVEHDPNCWLGSNYRESWTKKKCDCRLHSSFNPQRAKVLKMKENLGSVNGPYGMLFFYPAIGFHRFLTTGTVKNEGYDKELTEMLEAEVGFEPLQVS